MNSNIFVNRYWLWKAVYIPFILIMGLIVIFEATVDGWSEFIHTIKWNKNDFKFDWSRENYNSKMRGFTSERS